jgi:hypothetical protein
MTAPRAARSRSATADFGRVHLLGHLGNGLGEALDGRLVRELATGGSGPRGCRTDDFNKEGCRSDEWRRFANGDLTASWLRWRLASMENAIECKWLSLA